jgi:hypothetical protein
MVYINYYPYFRGKKYEILALRDFFVDKGGSNQQIFPIIEPIKKDFKDIIKLLSNIPEGYFLYIIANPSAGDNISTQDIKEIFELGENTSDYLSQDSPDKSKIRYAWDISKDTKVPSWIQNSTLPIAIVNNQGQSVSIEPLANFDKYIVSTDMIWQVQSQILEQNKIIVLQDTFEKKERNAEYADTSEYTFTRFHLFDSYAGYSDYLTIGSAYSSGGFTPRSVAIHWTYYKPDDYSTIYAKSFASERNLEERSGISEKFLESVGKLIRYVNNKQIHKTKSYKELEERYNQDRYPGLGLLKKYSMLNHLDMVSKSLENISD